MSDFPYSEGSISHVGTLDCDAFWTRHDEQIIAADGHTNEPFFYPVYRWKNLYSYSPLPLIRQKGYVNLNPKALQDLEDARRDVARPELFIDTDIVRLGRLPQLDRSISDRKSYVEKLAAAMKQDVAAIEMTNADTKNFILCGGRDSLNLLLLPWSHETIALSAQPNLPLVSQFVRDNGLGIEVRELRDEAPSPELRTREIAEACLMTDMSHWKWTGHLERIAAEEGRRAVFWKGQMADAFLTDFWRAYTFQHGKWQKRLRKVWRRSARYLPAALTRPMDDLVVSHFRRTLWERGAVAQGAHMGFLRSITQCLWLSGYHGPHTSSVWLSGDLPELTRTDLRPEIGQMLLGRPVIYPQTNPNPPASTMRDDWRTVPEFRDAMESFGVEISSEY